jgi:amphi-Trp domain-containing protein
VEKSKTEKEFVNILRRVADSIEKREAWRIQVQHKRVTVPKDAIGLNLSVEHEQEGDEHCIEFQVQWKTK